jgi:hypothetical protein
MSVGLRVWPAPAAMRYPLLLPQAAGRGNVQKRRGYTTLSQSVQADDADMTIRHMVPRMRPGDLVNPKTRNLASDHE